MSVLDTRQLNRALLARQQLLARVDRPALDTIEHLVALQAQVARPPFVGLWTRLANFRRGDLHALFHDRSAVRATTLRGTLHVMSAADFVALRGAIQPALTRGMESILRERAAGIEPAECANLAHEFFASGPATFDALRDFIEGQKPDSDVRALAYAIRVLVPFVQVPTSDLWAFPAAADFTLADDWLGSRISTEHSAAHDLVLRYLAAFGPATVKDAQTWSGLGNLASAFDDLRPRLITFRDEKKRELFDLPDAPRPDASSSAPIRYLPEFDNILLSHDTRTRIIADEHRPLVITKNLQVKATFLVDGFVAGIWRVERKRKVATLTLEPFGTLAKKTITALEREGDSLLRFVEPDAASYEIRV